MKHKSVKLLIFLTLAVFFAGCQKTDAPNRTESSKHLRVATSFRIQHLDPLKSAHYFLIEFGAVELPARLDADGRIKPWLLESFTQIDKLNWKLRLRPNIKFQNGKPLTAEIFARAMNRQLAESTETKIAVGEATAKANGANEVVLTTKTPSPNVPAALADETVFPIYDVETVEAVGADSLKLAGSGVHTGAYKIVGLNEREMILERHADYWRGTPPFERVSILFVSDPQARILAVQNGEADLALYPQTQNKRLLEGRTDAFFKFSESSANGPSLFFNLKIAPFDDVNVRRAVSLGIDYKTLANETMDGIYRPADGYYPPSFSWSKQNQRTDFEEAKKILDESGWRIGADGIREKNGRRLEVEILIYPQQADFSTLATALQAQLRQIGFDLKIRQADDIQSELKRSKTWNLCILGSGIVTTGGAPDPILQRYFLTDSEENNWGLNDAELDARIKLLSRTFDESERNKLLGEIQDTIIAEKAYLVRLGFTRARAVVAPKFKSYEPSPQLLHITFETKPD